MINEINKKVRKGLVISTFLLGLINYYFSINLKYWFFLRIQMRITMNQR